MAKFDMVTFKMVKKDQVTGSVQKRLIPFSPWDFLSAAKIPIGMNPCIEPHNSEHCPENCPVVSIEIFTSAQRPGIASALTASVGSAKAWITSTADNATSETPKESTAKFDTLIPNKSPTFKKLLSATSDESKAQYHCNPTKSFTDSLVKSTVGVVSTS